MTAQRWGADEFEDGAWPTEPPSPQLQAALDQIDAAAREANRQAEKWITVLFGVFVALVVLVWMWAS